MFFQLAAISALALLPHASQGFSVQNPRLGSPTALNYRHGIQQDVTLDTASDYDDAEDDMLSDTVGHSDDDEQHYVVGEAEGKQIEDELISTTFEIVDDIIEMAEDEAADAIMEAASDAVLEDEHGNKKPVKIINHETTMEALSNPSSVTIKTDDPEKTAPSIDRKKKKSKKGKKKKGDYHMGWMKHLWGGGKEEKVKESEEKVVSGTIKQAPYKNMTGVEERYTRLCATISGQIYSARHHDDFNVQSFYFDGKEKPKVIWFNDHGPLNVTAPTMAAVVVDKKMIVGWRGSTTMMDWIVDFAFAPVTSSRWHHLAKNIRVQGAYAALIESDMALYEDRLLDEIEQNDIEELIFTGHSLAGGVANVAHLMVAGERRKKFTAWNRSQQLRDLTVRSIAFSPPMTSMLLDRKDEVSRRFLQEVVGSKTCNIVYKSDPVPRGYADLKFISDMINSALEETTGDMSWLMQNGANVASLLFTGQRIKANAKSIYKDEITRHAELIRVAARFQHQGKIVYYSSASDRPTVCIDKGSYFNKPAGHNIPLFRDIKYKRPSESAASKDVTVFDVAGQYHNFLVTGPGLAYNIGDSGTE